jgi:pimeloyl-ACP methyl ester carboxylesterase
MSWGFHRESVTLHLADGTAIHGALYRPTAAREHLPLAVVLHGTALAHQSCVPGLAIPLAQHGYLTLALDLQGHGLSGGTVPRWELEQPARMLGTLEAHPEVDAGIDLLKREPGFDQKTYIPLVLKPLSEAERNSFPDRLVIFQRLALIGHSRGGWVAANVGFRRNDVASVVSIGAPPGTCDLHRPRNLLIVTGGKDELFPTASCEDAIAQATDGAIKASDQAFGCFWLMSARRLLKVNGADHFTELANPWITRKVVQWVASSLDLDSGEVPGDWLLGLTIGLLLTTVGGAPTCRWLLGHWSARLLGAGMTESHWRRWGLGLFFLGVVLAIFVVLVTRRWMERGPAYFLGPALALVATLALVSWAVILITGRPRQFPGSRWAAGTAMGLATFGLAVPWLGLPWGYTWLGLVPSTQRAWLGLVILPLALPSTLALAGGFGRLTETGRGQVTILLLRGLLWLAVPLVLWFANQFGAVPFYPMSVIPVALVAVSFLVPFPLWLLADRPGLTTSRAVAHALALTWLLACHLPFVDG